MSEFKQAIRPEIVTEMVPIKKEVPKDIQEGVDPDTDHFEETPEDLIDAYEAEVGHRISEDYFSARELMTEEFNLKMNVYAVDKYVKSYMKESDLEYSVDNFYKTLEEIESEIGTHDLDVIVRLRKLAEYTKIMTRMKKLKEDKKQYLSL